MLQDNQTFTNHLLRGLPKAQHERLLAKAQIRELKFNTCLYERGEEINEVFFPESGVVSLIAKDNGSSLEVGMVGRDGIVGLPLFLGSKIAEYRMMVQGAGQAISLPADDFRKLSADGEMLKRLLLFTHSLLNQVTRSAMCCRFHGVDERLARWLLIMHDHLETNEFALTQDFLSSMLGVRREAVNKSARVLQNSSLISYFRGNVTVTDRMGLEEASCSCYPSIKSEMVLDG